MKQVLVETRLFTAMPMSLSENNVSDRGLPLVEGILATAEVKNGNGRYYSKDLWNREIDKYKVLVDQHVPNKAVIIMDTVYFGREFGFMVFRDQLTKQNIYWQFVKHETMALYQQGIAHLQSLGWKALLLNRYIV